MNLVIVAPRLPPAFDGVGDHAHALASTFTEQGHCVTALATNEASTDQAYRVETVGPRWSLAATWRALHIIAAQRPAVVFIEYTPFVFGRGFAPLGIVYVLGLLRIPHIVIAHELFYSRISASWKACIKQAYFNARDRALCMLASAIAVTNEQRRHSIARNAPGCESKVDVIGIAANVEPPSTYRRHEHTSGPLDIVTFGVVMERRRYDMAIEALHILRKRVDANLTIIGRIFDSDYARQCEALAQRLGVAPHVRFTDALEAAEISHRFARADCALHTTVEGTTRSSGSLLSLLAHEVPVIATATAFDDPCFERVVITSQPTAHALAQCIAQLCARPEKACRLGKEAGIRYRSDFDWDAIARSLLGERRSRVLRGTVQNDENVLRT